MQTDWLARAFEAFELIALLLLARQHARARTQVASAAREAVGAATGEGFEGLRELIRSSLRPPRSVRLECDHEQAQAYTVGREAIEWCSDCGSIRKGIRTNTSVRGWSAWREPGGDHTPPETPSALQDAASDPCACGHSRVAHARAGKGDCAVCDCERWRLPRVEG